MFRNRASTLLLAVCCVLLNWGIALAQTTTSSVTEDFTGASTTNNWYFYNGACLTASTASGNTSPGSPNGCTKDAYYGTEPLVGGYNGVAGGTQTLPDPTATSTTSYGALRFTNGCVDSNNNGSCTYGGHSQNGAIISANSFSTSQGLDITFKTVTYRGDSGGNGAGCPSGASASNGQCVSTTTVSPNTSSACTTGTPSGGNCVVTTSPTVAYSCSSGTLSGSRCVVTTSPSVSYSCPSGYSLSGSNCVKTVAATVSSYSCSSGTLSGSNCVLTSAPIEGCPSGYTLVGSICQKDSNPSKTTPPTWSCPSGYTGSGSGASMTCTETVAATPSYTCPGGYTLSGSTCTTTIVATGSYSCPSGYTQGGTGSGTTCTESVAATAAYSCPSGYTRSGSGSGTTCGETVGTPTTTYSCPSGYTASGSGSGTTCTETTVVGQDPHQNDGADGMSFFLMDGSVDMTNNAIDHIGSWGGSLGYTCSNANSNYHGMVGGYLGLGIDEFGNFLNGTVNTLGVSNPQALGDNTASGGGQYANRIGLRGQGNIDWYWLNYNYSAYYPSSLTSAQQDAAVRSTCQTGTLWDYSNPLLPSNTGTMVMDYAAIPNAYTVISSTIAKEYSAGGYARAQAPPITYRLKLTEDGLLSLDYSYNGGAWTHVLQNQSIAASNGTVPSTVRFGFAGSTGGSSNIHEILCFKAAPDTQAASSTTVNQQQSSKVESGAQAYFGYYDPTDWSGRLTANSLVTDSSGNLTISATANWDASCGLTGVASGKSCPTTGQAGPTTAQAWQSSSTGGRVMLTWNGTAGIPLEWTNLSTAEQTAIDAGDATQTANRLEYLRGDRSNEIQTNGSGLYRDRDSVLGDIMDSSSTWIGPPSKMPFSAYESPATWKDRLYPTATMPENAGPTYDQFATTAATRQNVVYVGSNDGLLHGFSAGSYDSTGTTYNSGTNTGQEVLAYMPQQALETIHDATNSQLDYSNTQYGHNFYVDATPGTGDLYYNGAWHTWLVGGLGAGGAEIYALDVTDPTTFSEGNASSLVIGDWTQSNITCTNPATGTTSGCTDTNGNSYLGNTYGTPQIRRLHNGDWAVIFGNGIGSPSGDAGIFILTISQTGTQTLYYLSTGAAGNNGIAYATPVDMDGDHVVDFVYAGDLQGNVWRFNLTSRNPSAWAVSSGPLFKTPSGQPITTAIQPDFVTGPIGSTTQMMLFFGTGEKFPLTNTTATSYQTGTQYFYGVWDWKLSSWDANNSSQFASLSAATVGSLTGLASPYTLTTANLTQQTVSVDSSTGDREITSASAVCWAGTTTCTGGSSANASFGWYLALPGTNSSYSMTSYEQVVSNPLIVSTAVVFNSILPAIDSPLMCTPDMDKGWTYALDVRTGGPVPNFFVNPGTSGTTGHLNTQTVGYEADASGSSAEVDTNNGSGGTNYYLIFQSTAGGPGTPIQIQPGANLSGSRETWIQLR